MTQPTPTDLELSALISSKICHDVIGPVGAIINGLEILDEDGGVDEQSYALDVIRNVTKQASARLQFARFAFGASGSAGATIDLQTARDLAMTFVGDGKHVLTWNAPAGVVAKDHGKLILNLVSSAITALPRGGEIVLQVGDDLNVPTVRLSCTGKGARKPNFLTNLVAGETLDEIDSMSIQAYYTWRLAAQAGMQLAIDDADGTIVLSALPAAQSVAA